MTLKASFILFVFSGFLSFSQKYTVSQKVTYIEPYCGGARPSAEMQEKANSPQVFAKKTIVIVNEAGKACKVKTNAEGLFTIKLKAGNYKLYEVWRFNKKTPDDAPAKNYRSDCLKTEWQKDFAVLIVDSKKTDYKITNGIVNACYFSIPCVLDSLRPKMPE